MSGSGTDYTTTPTLGLYKPNYDMDDEQWGQHLNLNADMLDAFLSPGGNPVFVPVAGGVMTGRLTLSSDPTDPLGAVTKQYLDSHTGTGSQIYLGGWNPTTNTPTLASGALANGVLAPKGSYYLATVGGTSTAIDGLTTWLAGDYITSNGATWERVQASSSPYLPLAGGVVSGATTFGTNTTATNLIMNGQAGGLRRLQWNTAGVRRWHMLANATAEGGANAGSDLDLIATADDGATNTTVARFTRATGNVEFFKDTTHSGTTNTFKGGLLRTQAIAFSGTQANPGNYAIWMSPNYTGTSTHTGPFSLNNFSGTDTIANNHAHSFLSIGYYPSTGTVGGTALDVRAQDASSTGVSSGYGVMGVRSTVNMLFNQGGAASGLMGVNWCLLLAAGDGASPPNLYYNALRMLEMDMSIGGATSVGQKTFIKFSSDVSDLANGILDADCYMSFARGNLANPAYRYGLTFTHYDGYYALDSKTTVIDLGRPANGYIAAAGQKVGWVLDANAVEPQSGFIRSPGFLVDTDGTTQIGAMRLAYGAGGGTVGITGLVASAVTYASGGTGWAGANPFVLITATGASVGFGVISAVSSGVPTAIQIVRMPVLGSNASPPATLTARAVIGSGLPTTRPTDFTVNVTWGPVLKLTVGATGDWLGFGGAPPVAKPTVSGSRNANAALAALLTALASYGLITDSSTA